MELKGKVINFLGDSITVGVGASSPEKNFVTRIAEKTGAKCVNYGYSGTRIAKQTNFIDGEDEDRNFCIRASEMGPADIVVVFGGVNDFGHGDAPMGCIDDTDPATFCGALDYLYKLLSNQFSNAEIIIITPAQTNIQVDYSKGLPRLEEYVEKIKYFAQKYHFPVLDMYSFEQFNPNIPLHYEKYTIDGLHPNDAGYELISDVIISYLNKL